MRKVITVSFIVVIGMFILAESGVVEALVLFLLSGSLPGTTFVVSPTMMMLGLVAAAWLSITHIIKVDLLHLIAVRRLVKRYASKQARMPKRRYGRI